MHEFDIEFDIGLINDSTPRIWKQTINVKQPAAVARCITPAARQGSANTRKKATTFRKTCLDKDAHYNASDEQAETP